MATLDQTSLPFDFTPFIVEKTLDFTGREWVFADVVRWLSTTTASPVGPNLYYITGSAGCGKSAIAARLYQFSQGLQQPPRGPTPDIASTLSPGYLAAAHFCRMSDPDSLDPHLFTKSVALQLGKWHPDLRQAVAESESAELEQSISQLLYSGISAFEMFSRLIVAPLSKVLTAANVMVPPLLLVDAVEDALQVGTSDTIGSLLSWSLTSNPPLVRLIATGRQPAPAWTSVPGDILPLPGALEGFEDMRRYLQRRLRDNSALRQRVAARGPEGDVIESIVTSSGGNFVEATRRLEQYGQESDSQPEQIGASTTTPIEDAAGQLVQAETAAGTQTEIETISQAPNDAEPAPVNGQAASTEPESHPQESYRPPTQLVRDYWTEEDRLGHRAYADAIANFILHEQTVPPLTIGVTAAWGAGKTSLMRMVRDRLDPSIDNGEREKLFLVGDARRKLMEGEHPPTLITVLRRARQSSHLQDRELREMRVAPTTQDRTRQRPTVWFNPWMYQSLEQVWAGLAYEIISTLTDRMPPAEREHFWLALNMRRLDEQAVRRRIYRIVLENLLPIGGAVLLAILFFVALAVAGVTQLAGTLTSGAVGLGFVTSLLQAARVVHERADATLPALVKQPDYAKTWRSLVEDKPASRTTGLFRDPEYEGKLGFLYAVQADMKSVLDLIATPDYPVVVFVDDVDRCSSATVAQIIEAINLFLAGEFPNCVFVIALEPAVVAAHIEVAYKDLVARLKDPGNDGEVSSLGWRFLEKIVQLPLRLPARPPDDKLKEFLDSLVGEARSMDSNSVGGSANGSVVKTPQPPEGPAASPGVPAASTEGAAASPERVQAITSAIQAEAPALEEIGSAALRAQGSVLGSLPTEGFAPETLTAVQAYTAELLRDDNPRVRAVVDSSVDSLPNRNPREIKRFVNLLRFYGTISASRQTQQLPAANLEQVAKAAILTLRWPHLMDTLGRSAPNTGNSWLYALEQNAVAEPVAPNTTDDDAAKIIAESRLEWSRLLKSAGLAHDDPATVDAPLALGELRAFLREGVRIGSTAGLI